MTLQVEVLVPDHGLWSGTAGQVIAKTLDGDIGVLTGHAPVFGVLSEGSLVRILEPDGGSTEIRAAVSGGFLSVSEDRVSILAASAVLGSEVDVSQARQEAETAGAQEGSESAQARYARAQLRAANEQA